MCIEAVCPFESNVAFLLQDALLRSDKRVKAVIVDLESNDLSKRITDKALKRIGLIQDLMVLNKENNDVNFSSSSKEEILEKLNAIDRDICMYATVVHSSFRSKTFSTTTFNMSILSDEDVLEMHSYVREDIENKLISVTKMLLDQRARF